MCRLTGAPGFLAFLPSGSLPEVLAALLLAAFLALSGAVLALGGPRLNPQDYGQKIFGCCVSWGLGSVGGTRVGPRPAGPLFVERGNCGLCRLQRGLELPDQVVRGW